MKRTISGMVGKGSLRHNNRTFHAGNVDPERSHQNIAYCDENIRDVYHELFDEALEKYNAKQTRADRMIDDYYEKIRFGKQEKPFHEIIMQIGDWENTAVDSDTGKLATQILDISLIAVAILLVCVLAGCGSNKEAVATDGSTSMNKVISALGEAFQADTGITVTYNATGSGAGIQAVQEGRCGIGLSSRDLKDEEKASGLEGKILAYDGIAIIVNPQNPVSDLNLETIAKIYTGEITNWKEVGGDDAEIVLIGREAGSLLNKKMIEMGAECENIIALSTNALLEGNTVEARNAKEQGHKIDQMEREIESVCLKLLLQQQPVAKDLRVISAALKMITDMERIGDQAEDIAEIIPFLNGRTGEECHDIRLMAEATIKMVTESVDAYVKQDLEFAKSVSDYDDVVDDAFDRVKQSLIKMISENTADGEYALDLLMIAKYFERIGDHAVNIAEWVEFSVTGVHKGE